MKRFFDTEMVLRPWFRSLDPRLKCLWLFMVSRCDMAGVIDMDWGLASFAIGQPVTVADMQAMNGNAVAIVGSKILIPGFIPFQYGELNDRSPVHKGVLKALESHGIEYPFELDKLNRVSKGLSNPMDTTKDKDKDKDTATDKATEGGCKGESKPKTFKQWSLEDLMASVKEHNGDGLLTDRQAEDFCRYWIDERDGNGKSRLHLQKTWSTRGRMQTAKKMIYGKESGFAKKVELTPRDRMNMTLEQQKQWERENQ